MIYLTLTYNHNEPPISCSGQYVQHGLSLLFPHKKNVRYHRGATVVTFKGKGHIFWGDNSVKIVSLVKMAEKSPCVSSPFKEIRYCSNRNNSKMELYLSFGTSHEGKSLLPFETSFCLSRHFFP